MTLEQIIERERERRTEGGQFGIDACKDSIRFYLEHGQSLEEQLDEYVERANKDVFFNKHMVLACWEMIEEQKAATTDYFMAMEADSNRGKQISRGQHFAYRAWRNTVEYGAEMFEAHDIPWGSDLAEGVMADFINTLRDAGIKTFAVTDHSTALMEGLHAIFATGCTLVGPVVVKRHPPYWGDEEHAGLAFKIN